MRAVVQRVQEATVVVDDEIIGEIGAGMLIFLGISRDDGIHEASFVADKCLNLRIFENEAGKFHYSVLDLFGDILVVSQFTLYGDTRKGRRPSFDKAAPPTVAEPLYETFVEMLRKSGLRTATGRFGAMMDVRLVNDGPVTILVEK